MGKRGKRNPPKKYSHRQEKGTNEKKKQRKAETDTKEENKVSSIVQEKLLKDDNHEFLCLEMN